MGSRAVATDAAATVAAAVAALVAVRLVPYGQRLARKLPGAGARDGLIFTVALLSPGAVAIHFALAKTHFEECTVFCGCCAGGVTLLSK